MKNCDFCKKSFSIEELSLHQGLFGSLDGGLCDDCLKEEEKENKKRFTALIKEYGIKGNEVIAKLDDTDEDFQVYEDDEILVCEYLARETKVDRDTMLMISMNIDYDGTLEEIYRRCDVVYADIKKLKDIMKARTAK